MFSWIPSIVTAIGGISLATFAVVHMMRQRRSPQTTLAWLLAMALLPYVGVPLYFLLGGRKIRRLIREKDNLRLTSGLTRVFADITPTDYLLQTYGLPPATMGNRLELFTDGQQTYSGLIDLIDSATRSLHITVFIFGKDEMARDIVARLAKRAAEGIDVRVLIDSVGSFWTRKEVVEPLLRASGRVVRFLPVLSAPLRGRANLRNHRKIILADDARVIAGGINIASNYFGPTDDPQRWQDLAFYIEGPATHSFAEIFRSDWAFATGERIAISEDAHPPQATGNAVIQVVPAGPDVRDDPLYVAILSAIFTATSRVWIVSPYFIPNDTLAQALALAARRGVDVRILVPKRSNHRLTDFARDTYLRQVQESGGIIQHYVPGMMHAKAVLVDDSFAVIGSANFDMRSLFLSFEVAAFVYSRSEIDSLEDWMETLMRRSEIGIEEAGFAREMVESAVRLFATQL